MIAEYIQHRPNLAHVFVLIDSRLKPQKLDIDFINQLHGLQKPYSIAFTKSDQITQREVSETIKLVLAELSKTIETPPRYFITSAQKRQSTHGMIAAIHEMNKGG